MSNLSGLFDDVNTQVGNIAQQVGTKPSSFEPRVFAMIEALSRNVVLSLLGQMSGTTSTSVLGANRIEDVQTLVQKINDYRNAAVTEGIYQAFQNDVDPNGNPYGYDSLTGQRSNNLQHGVTWNYANGIYNDTAEIISLAAVYYQQDIPQ